ncbi:hypothetical protein IQ07DRAFT_214612 [Pyrenochaeta sp. DS3sAY3a]|nr:hypothetical protein IQ07DRAFT_214612 [Pyrenochaeta sp. DS3sAY3a]
MVVRIRCSCRVKIRRDLGGEIPGHKRRRKGDVKGTERETVPLRARGNAAAASVKWPGTNDAILAATQRQPTRIYRRPSRGPSAGNRPIMRVGPPLHGRRASGSAVQAGKRSAIPSSTCLGDDKACQSPQTSRARPNPAADRPQDWPICTKPALPKIKRGQARPRLLLETWHSRFAHRRPSTLAALFATSRQLGRCMLSSCAVRRHV